MAFPGMLARETSGGLPGGFAIIMSFMQVAILSIGDELVLGQTLDTNSAFLSQQLAERGIMTLFHQTVADDLPVMVRMIQQATEQVDVIIITGGLGPTDDDLTRQALAQAMNVELVLDEDSLHAIDNMFARRGKPTPDMNRVQAYHPVGSEMLPNDCGTAPGIVATLGRATIYVVPGVPSEMKRMWETSIEPQMRKLAATGRFLFTRKINTFGRGESAVAEQLGSLCDRDRNPMIGTTVADGIVSIRVRSEFDAAELAQLHLDQATEQIEQLLGDIVFGHDDQTIQQSLVELLMQQKRTLAVAESCTGGLIGQMLTEVPGASSVILGGWITYANEMKIQQLGVPAEAIAEYGAVSEEVVRAMVQGAQKRSGSDLAIAITGIAGPDGGTDDKPVGTVWVGLADGSDVITSHFIFNGNREVVRDRAAKTACQMLRLRLLGKDGLL